MHDVAESVRGRAGAALFPLPLSPLERFFLTDDRPQYPMAFTIQSTWRGVADRGAFEQALKGALQRHPLLSARVRRSAWGRWRWVPTAEVQPFWDWGPAEKPIHCVQEQIDLRREVGLRVWARQGAEELVLTTQFHHACTDGIGAYRFLGDWLALYGQALAGEGPSPELVDLDPELLRDRKLKVTRLVFRPTTREVFYRIWQQTMCLYGHVIIPLDPPVGGPLAERAEFPGIRSYSFERSEYDAIRRHASALGVTTNDLLLGLLLRTLAEWNRRHGDREQRGALRIVLPADMRESSEDYQMPAANLVGYTLITRRPPACADLTQLVREVRDETALIKHEQRGTWWNDTLAAAAYVPGMLRLVTIGKRCLSTAVLSNVGDPSRRFTAKFPRVDGKVVAGNLVLEEITGVPPMRPGTRATFSVFNYLRKLTISVRGDPCFFRGEDTQALLDLFVEQLQAFA